MIIFQILSTACFAIAVVLLACELPCDRFFVHTSLVRYIYIGVSYTLITVSVVFVFLTLLDLIGFWLHTPIHLYLWSIVCVTAGVFFFFACGLLIAVNGSIAWMVVFAVVYGLTAIVFLVDLIWSFA